MDYYQNATKIDTSMKVLQKPSYGLKQTDKHCFLRNSISLQILNSNQAASKIFLLWNIQICQKMNWLNNFTRKNKKDQ